MESIGRPETSVTNYQYRLRNIPEQQKSQITSCCNVNWAFELFTSSGSRQICKAWRWL